MKTELSLIYKGLSSSSNNIIIDKFKTIKHLYAIKLGQKLIKET